MQNGGGGVEGSRAEQMLGRDPHQTMDALLGDLLPNLDQGAVVDVMILDVPGGPVSSIGAFAFQELLTLSSHVRPEDTIFLVPSTSQPKCGRWRFMQPSMAALPETIADPVPHWSCWGMRQAAECSPKTLASLRGWAWTCCCESTSYGVLWDGCEHTPRFGMSSPCAAFMEPSKVAGTLLL